MNEEEKKAIERIEDIIYKRDETNYADNREITLYEDDIQKISKLLNLIDKKQKEEMNWEKIYSEDQDYIAELNNKIFDLECSIDKQQEEIKELKEDISNMYDKKVVRNILEDEYGLSKYEIDELLEEE